jgi:carbamoyltransferase
MKILGISAHYHDSAAALVVDGVPVAAVQEERLSRKKHDAGFPLAAIEWCLDAGGVAPEALDAVVFYEKPMLKLERILVSALRAFPRSWSSFPRAMKNSFGGKVWVKGLIASHLGVPGAKILFTEHHQAHAACAYYTAPTRNAAIVTADGVGEWATFTVGRGEGARVTVEREIRWPHSLGMLYSTFTAFLGFEVNEDEYKVMGLAAYGQPRFADEVRALVRRGDDGAFALDLAYFDYHAAGTRAWSRRFEERFGPPRAPLDAIDLETEAGRRWADLAASVQRVLEDEMVAVCRRVHEDTGLSDLCLGGGVALNVCANARVLAETGFERVFVPPAPGDAGCALGAALYADRVHFGAPDRALPDHPFWGPPVDGADLARVAREDGLPVEELGDALVARVADELAAGKVVGWMDGPCELGPRALGGRSILAAPHDAAMRDRLNQKIKFREEFRPFAPCRARRGGRRVVRAARRRRAPVPLHVGRVPRARARAPGRRHPRRRQRPRPGGRRRHGAAPACAPPRLRRAHRRAGPGQHLVQPGGRAHRHQRARGLLDLPALGARCPRRARRAGAQGGARVTLKKRGKLAHAGLLVWSAFSAIVDGVRGLWRGRAQHRWLVPLLVFLCVTGLFLAVAATVEALAPFLYSIF